MDFSTIQWKEVCVISMLCDTELHAISEVESIFMPWLMRQAEKALDEKILARMVLDG